MNKPILLIEEDLDNELSIYEHTLEEGQKPNIYIEGLFLQANTPNKNKRIYPMHILEKQVSDYIDNYIDKGCALGELDHPTTPHTNLQRVSHIVENLQKDGTNYIGRARILSTPMGEIAKNLINEGIRLGVSSRGTGSLLKNGKNLVVTENFKLMGIDLVCNPSVKDAVVEAIYENQDWSLNLFENDEEFYNFRNILNRSIKELKLHNIIRNAKY